jgi:hypothetical protein
MLGPIKRFLGLTVHQELDKVYINQAEYITSLLQKTKMMECKSVLTPIGSYQISKDDCPKTEEDIVFMKSIPYRQVVGSLLWIAGASRPDIAAAVNIVSRYSQNPGRNHWYAVKRILQYLKGSINMGLCLGGDSPLKLSAFSDADWAGDPDSRKSTSGYIIKLGNSLISWSSKRQPNVALSSCESELYAMTSAAQALMSIKNVMEDIHLKVDYPVTMYEDNQSAIAIVNNQKSTKRAKHVDLRVYFIKDLVKRKVVTIEYCPTEDMPADLLTKDVNRVKLAHHLKILGLVITA